MCMFIEKASLEHASKTLQFLNIEENICPGRKFQRHEFLIFEHSSFDNLNSMLFSRHLASADYSKSSLFRLLLTE